MSKLEELRDPAAKAVMREIAGRFVSSVKGTPVHEAKAALARKRHLLDELVQLGFLRFMGDKYFPGFLAFESEDADLRDYCRRCTEIVLEALKRLYTVKGEKSFPFVEVLTAAQAVDSSMTPEMVNLGLLMPTDFSSFIGGWSLSGVDVLSGKDVVSSVTLREDILDFETLESAWSDVLLWRESAAARRKLIEPPRVVPRGLAFAPLTEVSDFSFVADNRLRHIVQRDHAELQRMKTVSALKSRLIVAGGLIEALLLDALQAHKDRALRANQAEKDRNGQVKPMEEWHLGSLIDVASELRLITPAAQKFSHGIRDYRNLVHPGKEIRSAHKLGVEEADIAEKVLDIVIRDLQSGGKKHD